MAACGRKSTSTPLPSDATVPEREAARLDAIEARLAQVEVIMRELVAELRYGRAEAAAAIVKPSRRAPKLSAEQRKAIRVQTAALARAAKPVGTGMGAVKTTKTKRQLEAAVRSTGNRR